MTPAFQLAISDQRLRTRRAFPLFVGVDDAGEIMFGIYPISRVELSQTQHGSAGQAGRVPANNIGKGDECLVHMMLVQKLLEALRIGSPAGRRQLRSSSLRLETRCERRDQIRPRKHGWIIIPIQQGDWKSLRPIRRSHVNDDIAFGGPFLKRLQLGAKFTDGIDIQPVIRSEPPLNISPQGFSASARYVGLDHDRCAGNGVATERCHHARDDPASLGNGIRAARIGDPEAASPCPRTPSAMLRGCRQGLDE